MIDHVSVGVRDLERAARFYEAVLGAIGYIKRDVRPATVGFGKKIFGVLDQSPPAFG
jgi:catechol 2,3-dioxygenase-like lactoylglutathione lyase family enzyme